MENEIKWSIDPTHSEIGFEVKHLIFSTVHGSFRKFDANIFTSGKDFTTARVNFCMDTSSISTGDLKRDEHLKSIDFFDAGNYKQITFVSNDIGKSNKKGDHVLWGELTIKNITKRFELNVIFGEILKDASGNEKAEFTITGKLNRSDWGLTWNAAIETGGLMVSEEATIICKFELINENQHELIIKAETSADKG